MAEHLKRRIGLGLLTAYGVGVMVGAGIYVLVGVVAGSAGMWAPLAFILAGLVALPSALSYAELTARMPVAAGEAEFVERGFGSRPLALIVGLFIVAAGIVSAAAVLQGGVGYLTSIVAVDRTAAIIIGGAFLTLVAAIGVVESLAFAAIFTVVEVIGLLLVSWAGFSAPPVSEWHALPSPEWGGISIAVGLCFFAFIGFEDLENMAEEVRDPVRIMPRGILLSLAITASLYGLVSLAAVRSVPVDVLAKSEQPLALVWQTAMSGGVTMFAGIAVAAAVNGVLAQIIMASRVLFGLGRKANILAIFNKANKRSGTPLTATIVAGAIVIFGSLVLPIETLARITSALLLAVFFLVNMALIRIKRASPDAPFRIPNWVPWFGLLAALLAMLANLGVFG